jgi:hypothetical protein
MICVERRLGEASLSEAGIEGRQANSLTQARHSRQPVIPGKAAGRDPEARSRNLDSRLRGNDGQGGPSRFCLPA